MPDPATALAIIGKAYEAFDKYKSDKRMGELLASLGSNIDRLVMDVAIIKQQLRQVLANQERILALLENRFTVESQLDILVSIKALKLVSGNDDPVSAADRIEIVRKMKDACIALESVDRPEVVAWSYLPTMWIVAYQYRDVIGSQQMFRSIAANNIDLARRWLDQARGIGAASARETKEAINQVNSRLVNGRNEAIRYYARGSCNDGIRKFEVYEFEGDWNVGFRFARRNDVEERCSDYTPKEPPGSRGGGADRGGFPAHVFEPQQVLDMNIALEFELEDYTPHHSNRVEEDVIEWFGRYKKALPRQNFYADLVRLLEPYASLSLDDDSATA